MSLAVQSIIGSNSPGPRYGQQSDIPKTSHVKLSQGINIFYERERKRERQGERGGEDSGDREEDVLIALVKCEFFFFLGEHQ